jgi:hypothetical protein
MEHYLAIEGEIIERLHAQVPQLLDVLSSGDSSQLPLEAVAKRMPCAIVMFDGEQVGGEQSRSMDSTKELATQRWVVFVGARSVAQGEGGKQLRDTAGPMISLVRRALAGWQPASATRPLKRITARGGPEYRQGGLGFFPLAFEAQVMHD